MLLKNGKFATSTDIFYGDLRTENGIIKEIGKCLDSKDNEEVINLLGMLVIPGGVDVHTHLNLDVGIAIATDDFYTGTVAAAFGGTTTIIDHMGFGPKGCNLGHQVDVYHQLAKDKAVIDYSFHGVFQHVDDLILEEMEQLIEKGITSYKIYLTYDYKLSDDEVYKVLERAKELGIVITVHPENDGVIKYLKSKYQKENCLTPMYHAKSRPLECEAEAINRMLLFSHMAGDTPIYIVHLSNGLGLDFIQAARDRGQKNVFAETCPQYLLLDESKYNEPDNEGLKYIMSPPLRAKENNDLLWQGVEKSYIDTIATDHCPFFFHKEKQMGKDNFAKCPNGAPGIEPRIPLMYSEGVYKGRISIQHFVDLCCTKPAKIFGLYPKKGTIAIGSDADLVVIDQSKKTTMSKKILHENVDYTPYEDIRLKGYPIMTISRGEIIVKDGKFLGEKGRGEFIKRNTFSQSLI